MSIILHCQIFFSIPSMPPPRPEWKEGKLCQYIRMKRPALVICELLRFHKNTRESNDTAAPTWNKFFTFNIRLSKYMYGMIKTLNEIRLFRIPFFPNIRPGMDITHANTMETMGIGDHDRPPVIARSQMQHTMSPIKRIIENSAEIITFAAILFSSFLQYTYFLLFNTNYRLICSIQLLVWHKSHSIIVYGEGNMSI